MDKKKLIQINVKFDELSLFFILSRRHIHAGSAHKQSKLIIIIIIFP